MKRALRSVPVLVLALLLFCLNGCAGDENKLAVTESIERIFSRIAAGKLDEAAAGFDRELPLTEADRALLPSVRAQVREVKEKKGEITVTLYITQKSMAKIYERAVDGLTEAPDARTFEEKLIAACGETKELVSFTVEANVLETENGYVLVVSDELLNALLGGEGDLIGRGA